MSYNVSVYASPEGEHTCECGHSHIRARGELVSDTNYTSNTSGMWIGGGVDLREYDGRRAGDLIEPLGRLLEDMRARPDHYRQWEPENGWGSYEGTVQWLAQIYAAVSDHPNGLVEVSC